MKVRRNTAVTAVAAAIATLAAPAASGSAPAVAAVPVDTGRALCAEIHGGVYPAPSAEPLAGCQWDMALVNADAATRARATGAGVRVGVIDSGVDVAHPDIAPSLDLATSCSFVRPDDPSVVAGLADRSEAAAGDCTDKAAVQDRSGHGTHVASIIAAPADGVGIAGVAPEATVVALKACTAPNFCYGYAVAAALRYAGDLRLDIVNLSLFADPYLFYCGDDAEQRAMMRQLRAAARYAQQRGVLLVSVTGNDRVDLDRPIRDTVSPTGPGRVPVTRPVGNDCLVLPAELPGVLAVSATGPVGYPGYTRNIAGYSSVGGDIAAPGGDFYAASGTVQDGVLGALPADSTIYRSLEPLGAANPGITVADGPATYGWIFGTSMAAPHVTGVAALVKQLHPRWGRSALASAVLRTAAPLACPQAWEPLGPDDQRLRCHGGPGGRTSFFGAGLVDAAAATSGPRGPRW